MADTFLTRIPSLSDGELRAYLDGHGKYQLAAVEAAAAEMTRRGAEVPGETLAAIRAAAAAREEAPAAVGFLRDARGPRRRRIRAIAAGILGAGVLAAALLHRAASAMPYDLEPEDSKVYLRQLEMMGGKANVMASQFRRGFLALWQGTNLAWTVLALSAAVAVVFYVAATQTGSTARHQRG